MNFFRIRSANCGNPTQNIEQAEVKNATPTEPITASVSSRFPEFSSPMELERIKKEAQHMLRGR